MLVSEKYLFKLHNETNFMKIGHTMPELQPFSFHQKLVTHPITLYIDYRPSGSTDLLLVLASSSI